MLEQHHLVTVDVLQDVARVEHERYVLHDALVVHTGVHDDPVVDEVFVHTPRPVSPTAGGEDMRAVERAHIVDMLERCGWKVKGHGNAAERLGLNSSTLRARMKKLGITRPNS